VVPAGPAVSFPNTGTLILGSNSCAPQSLATVLASNDEPLAASLSAKRSFLVAGQLKPASGAPAATAP